MHLLPYEVADRRLKGPVLTGILFLLPVISIAAAVPPSVLWRDEPFASVDWWRHVLFFGCPFVAGLSVTVWSRTAIRSRVSWIVVVPVMLLMATLFAASINSTIQYLQEPWNWQTLDYWNLR